MDAEANGTKWCDDMTFTERADRLAPADKANFVTLIGAYRPLVKMLDNAPLLSTIEQRLELGWGEHFDTAYDAAASWLSIAKTAQNSYDGALYPEPLQRRKIGRDSLYSFTVRCRCYCAFNIYRFDLELSPTVDRIAELGEFFGITDEAAMMLSEPMLNAWYAPAAAKLAVNSRIAHGEQSAMSTAIADDLRAYCDKAFSLVMQLLSSSAFVQERTEAIKESFTKKELAEYSYQIERQVLAYCSPAYARRHGVTKIHPKIQIAMSRPSDTSRRRTVSDWCDKLLMIEKGKEQADKVNVAIINCGMRTGTV